MHMHDWVEHERTIGGGGEIEQDVPHIKSLEPLAMAVHLAQICEDIDYVKSKHYDMPQALYESREGVRSDLGL